MMIREPGARDEITAKVIHAATILSPEVPVAAVPVGNVVIGNIVAHFGAGARSPSPTAFSLPTPGRIEYE